MPCTTRAQVSLEYLMILGIALFLLVPIISLFYSSTIESQNMNNANLMILSGRTISTTAETVYYQGSGSRIKIGLNFPDGVTSKIFTNNSVSELVMNAEFDGLSSDFVFFSDANMTFSNSSSANRCLDPPQIKNDGSDILSSGPKTLFIESCGQYVVIYEYES